MHISECYKTNLFSLLSTWTLFPAASAENGAVLYTAQFQRVEDNTTRFGWEKQIRIAIQVDDSVRLLATVAIVTNSVADVKWAHTHMHPLWFLVENCSKTFLEELIPPFYTTPSSVMISFLCVHRDDLMSWSTFKKKHETAHDAGSLISLTSHTSNQLPLSVCCYLQDWYCPCISKKGNSNFAPAN